MEKIILSITELNQLLNAGLTEMFPLIQFQGEISEITNAVSGHIYLTLKDESSSVPAVIWRNSAYNSTYKPIKSDLVSCIGTPNIYAKNARLQLVITKIEPLGLGALEQKFQELKNKLEKEGIFANSRKRKIPKFPRKIGIITSAKGAALQDILVRIKARNPKLNITIYDSLVQGDEAVKQLISGIEYFNQNEVDFIILTRGGGSLSDLWCFNSEKLVRAIFSSKTPIVSAVGHEVDITLSDLVADLRVPTPTAAAEILIPSIIELIEKLNIFQKKLNLIKEKINLLRQDLDYLNKNLLNKVTNYFEIRKLYISQIKLKFNSVKPDLKNYQQNLNLNKQKLSHLSTNIINKYKNKINLIKEMFLNLSPEQVLKRGYSIIRLNKKNVTSVSQLKENDQVEIELKDGKIFARIENG